jgi:hypothetical protein
MAKTLDEGFETFLGWLVPLSTEHDTAEKHKDSVKSSLVNNFKCTNFFETGSFGNATGVRHYSDTDYFAVIPLAELWSSSSYSLTKVKEALQGTFPRTTGIEVSTPAVKIPFGTYASETLEATPCTFAGLKDTPVGNLASYYIADGAGGWMQSSPAAHNKYVKQQDERLNYKLKPLIRLIKAWKFYNNVPISSFYLELRVTKYAEGERSIVYSIDIKNIMKFLSDNDLPGIQDPMGISGYINPCSSDSKKEDALSKVKTGASRSEKANAEREGNLDLCFEWWDKFFGGKFPSR